MKITSVRDQLVFDENIFIVSKTDIKGNIVYGNELFIEISGYSEKELIGAPHNILRHPDMPKAIFKLLWDNLKADKEIFAYVKNLNKSGKYYWVHAYVTPIYDIHSGSIIGYHSVRRSPNPEAIAIIEPLYQAMLLAEKSNGIEASLKVLEKKLSQLKVNYDAFILSFE